jgi:hypothetical protein
MTDENVGRHWSRNRLLAAIPAIDRALLEPHAQFVELAPGQVLFETEEVVVITHFPLTGTMAALIVVLEDGRTAEAASIGREGAIGGIISAGHKPAFTRAVVQSVSQSKLERNRKTPHGRAIRAPRRATSGAPWAKTHLRVRARSGVYRIYGLSAAILDHAR